MAGERSRFAAWAIYFLAASERPLSMEKGYWRTMNGGLVSLTRMSPNLPRPSNGSERGHSTAFAFRSDDRSREHRLVGNSVLEREHQAVPGRVADLVEISSPRDLEGDEIAGLIEVLEGRSLSDQGHVIRARHPRAGSREHIACQVGNRSNARPVNLDSIEMSGSQRLNREERHGIGRRIVDRGRESDRDAAGRVGQSAGPQVHELVAGGIGGGRGLERLAERQNDTRDRGRRTVPVQAGDLGRGEVRIGCSELPGRSSSWSPARPRPWVR